MKRKIVGIILIIIVVLLIAIGSILLINKDYTDKQIDSFLAKYDAFYQYISAHPIYDEGDIDVNANYRGAHGENYPNRFTFDYKLDDSLVLLSNESGYKEYTSDNRIYKLIEGIRKLDINNLNKILKESKIEDNKVIIDGNKISEITGLNIDNISITFNSSNIIKKLKRIDIDIDDIKISIEDNNIKIDYKDNNINIKINSSGYYMNINEKLKMNAFLNSNKNTYSIIIKDKVLSIEISDTDLKVLGGFESAIYNSIELMISKEEKIIEKGNELEINDIPILRYFTNTDLSFWN